MTGTSKAETLLLPWNILECGLLLCAGIVFVLWGTTSLATDTSAPVYSSWDYRGTKEKLGGLLDEREGGHPVGGPLHPIVKMLPLPFSGYLKTSIPTSLSTAQREDVIAILNRFLRYPYVSSQASQAVSSSYAPPGKRVYVFSYKCVLRVNGKTYYHRVLYNNASPKSFGHNVYIDGLEAMKTAEDVKTRIREVFKYEGALVAEPPFARSPRTFKVKSKDGKWHFRGGQTTLISGGDDPTTTVVNALAAKIYE